MHIDDLMQAFDLALGNPLAIGRTFNIAGPSAFDYGIAADYLSRKLGVPTVAIANPKYHSFEIDTSRARTVLGYDPENDFFRMADRAMAARQSSHP